MTTKSFILPFRDFVDQLPIVTFDEIRSTPGAQVQNEEAFEAMKQHLRDLYYGVDVKQTFVQPDGQTVDCIPIDRHPSVTQSGGAILSPPTRAPLIASSAQAPPDFVTGSDHTRQPLSSSSGGAAPCSTHTLPMPRITLQQLARFRNLRSFLEKQPPGGIDLNAQPRSLTKRYALGLERVANVGGSSHVNVWTPFVSALQEQYCQQWYTATQGTTLQTVECGWHIDRERYGDNHPHLFVYWTPNSYDTGCFNLDCGFFVPNPSATVYPGISLVPSQTDGAQAEYLMGFMFTGDAWWLHFNGQWVGYYPASLFQGGPLASHADTIEVGGEVGTGFSFWPPMGSGAFAAAGYRRAAYQRDVLVTPVGGATRSAALVANPSPCNCYSLDVTNWSGSSWGTYLFYGGPGGSSC